MLLFFSFFLFLFFSFCSFLGLFKMSVCSKKFKFFFKLKDFMKLLYFKKRKWERFSGTTLRYNWFSLIFWCPTPFLQYTFYSFQLKTCISVTLYSFLLVFLFNCQSTFICKASNKYVKYLWLWWREVCPYLCL